MNREPIKDALLGIAIGDTIGVPVEFESRAQLLHDPVTGVRGYGTHGQPPGTWSDDSSLTFCLAEMLCAGFDLEDLARRFINWRQYGYWTANGNVFDIGIGTSQAISRLEMGVTPVLAGGSDSQSNGNGSLMRILPLVFYLADKDIAERFKLTREVSALTHGHIRSVIACFLYLELGRVLLTGIDKHAAYRKVCAETKEWLLNADVADKQELMHFERILSGRIAEVPLTDIRSSGYVIHTLEASLWCFLTTNNYKEAVLSAVNMGEDTDTTAAVTGGLAGLTYGWETIPSDWLKALVRKRDIEDLSDRLRVKTNKQWQKPTS